MRDGQTDRRIDRQTDRQRDRRMDGRTEGQITKLIVAFRNFARAPNIMRVLILCTHFVRKLSHSMTDLARYY